MTSILAQKKTERLCSASLGFSGVIGIRNRVFIESPIFLSLRWIISGCDAFIDNAICTTGSAIFMNATIPINTLKTYETQELLYQANEFKLNEQKVDALYSKHLPIYEELTYFRIGTDDTLTNMRIRHESFTDSDELATTALLYVFNRLQNIKSTFNTIKKLHTDERSYWW
ncbi:hypothetical protein [Psychrobacter sp. 72-O-c]|uniref:hypothetical protein n=1 Tax=Psychrobacter sp. 72-O-c TaxID=2774125 RepID=UPI00191B8779|nr:hypothetical protein [Psychrobacter sp. 72-O-c]